ncbi:DUF1326 domain-containing protein [soil metagenome]
MATATKTAWQLKGTVVVACNCEYGCPCNFNALPSHGHCEGGWIWQVDAGHHGDVSLDGLSFSLLCDWPGAIHEGDGEAMMLIDERADKRQRETIERFLRGEIGGPWGVLANTYATWHGPHIVPFEIDLTGERSSIRAGEALELATEPIRNPVTGAEVHPRAVLPEGMIFKDGALLASSIFKVRDGVSYDHSGKYAALAPFEYQ